MKISEVIEKLENIQRFDVGSHPDGCPSSSRDDEGEWASIYDIEEIIKNLKES